MTDEETKRNLREVQAVGRVSLADASVVEAPSTIENPPESEDKIGAGTATGTIDPQILKAAVLDDPNRVRTATLSIDLDRVGAKDARIIMSEEHKNLGYRPPSDSLAAKAQRSSAKHPYYSLGLDSATLREAARADAERIK